MHKAVAAAVLATACGLTTLGPGRASADAPSGATVAITSPTNGGGVNPDIHLNVSVTATGTADPSTNTTIESMQLLVDQAGQIYNAQCLGSGTPSNKCTYTYTVNTARWTGTNHTLQVRMQTSDNSVANSPVVTTHLFSPTSLYISPPGPGSEGEDTYVTGIVSAPSGAGVSGQPVTLHFTPVYGAPSSVTVTTSSGGGFQAPYKLISNTAVTVNVLATQRWGASSGTTSMTAGAEPDCTVAHSTVKRGQSDTITCQLPGLPAGVATTLTYSSGKKFLTYSHSKSTKSKATFTFKLKNPGKIQLGVTVAANKVYGTGGGVAHVTVK